MNRAGASAYVELPIEHGLVRSWRPGDEAALARQADDRRVWTNLRDRFPFPYTLRDAEAWITLVTSQAPQTHFAIVVDGQVAGACGFEPQPDIHHLTAEVGFWLGPAWWGRGLATEALGAVTAHAFRRHDLLRLFAMVFHTNAASLRVCEKAGYTREAVLRRAAIKEGRVLDVVVYARLREDGGRAASP